MRRRYTVLLVVLCIMPLAGFASAETRKPHAENEPRPTDGQLQIDGDMLRLRMPRGMQSTQPARKTLPRSSQEWLAQMLDSSRHGVAFKDPQAFVEWLDAITEPQFMTALATASADPNTYTSTLNTMIRPETARNWAEFTNPLLYLRWMLTGSNPDFYNAIVERLVDPGKAARWARFGDTARSTSPAFKVSSPETMIPWAKMANPQTYVSWLNEFALGATSPDTPLPAWSRLPKPPTTPIYRY